MNPGFSKLVECVPNISEGRDRVAISRIVESVAMVPGVRILHVDSGVTTNRTVITFVGEPTVCLRAGVALFDAAVEHIDMRKHTGAHPRLGAVDVFPFVPLERTSMAECIALAHELGELVWERVFFYEHAAKQRQRQNLATVRRGEYEGLPEKLKDPNWLPDCGAPQRNERSGATIIGARTFLVAYNISLGAADVKVARTIAAKLRESGSTQKQEDGTTTQTPGRFTHCRAIGCQGPELGGAQVSVNFTDFSITGLYPVFEACVQEARAQGTSVKGSELIGLVPKQALLDVTSSLTSGLGDDSLTEQARL